jgi:hypothetical protein
MTTDSFDRSMLNPAIVFDVLADHRGASNGISARQLVFHLLGHYSDAGERHLRTVVEALRKEGLPVCAHPAHGYYIAENAQEIDQTCLFLYHRAMTSLRQVAAMKRVALPDFRGQLQLPIEEGEAA